MRLLPAGPVLLLVEAVGLHESRVGIALLGVCVGVVLAAAVAGGG